MSSNSAVLSHRKTFTALLALLLTAVASTLLALPAAADTEEAPPTVWSLTPAPQDDEDDRVSFRFDVPPGDSVEDAVELTNFSAQEATFTLEAADGVVSDSGVFDILRPGEDNEAAGQWIELDQQEVTVPADESVTVPFTITVPENATPGDQPAGIAASVSTGGNEDVSMVSRVGSRIHLRVDGDIEPTLTVNDMDVTYHQNWNPFAPGTATITYTVANEGNVRLGVEQAVHSAGPFGLAGADEQPEPIREVLPGGEAQVQVQQQVWPLFALHSTVELDPQIVGEDEIDAELTTSSGDTTAAAIPIPQLIILIIIGLLIWWFASRKKRNQKKFDAAVAAAAAQRHGSEEHTEDDDVEDLTQESQGTSDDDPPTGSRA